MIKKSILLILVLALAGFAHAEFDSEAYYRNYKNPYAVSSQAYNEKPYFVTRDDPGYKEKYYYRNTKQGYPTFTGAQTVEREAEPGFFGRLWGKIKSIFTTEPTGSEKYAPSDDQGFPVMPGTETEKAQDKYAPSDDKGFPEIPGATRPAEIVPPVTPVPDGSDEPEGPEKFPEIKPEPTESSPTESPSSSALKMGTAADTGTQERVPTGTQEREPAGECEVTKFKTAAARVNAARVKIEKLDVKMQANMQRFQKAVTKLNKFDQLIENESSLVVNNVSLSAWQAEYKQIKAEIQRIQIDIKAIQTDVLAVQADMVAAQGVLFKCKFPCPDCPPGYAPTPGVARGIVCAGGQIDAIKAQIKILVADIKAMHAKIDIQIARLEVIVDQLTKIDIYFGVMRKGSMLKVAEEEQGSMTKVVNGTTMWFWQHKEMKKVIVKVNVRYQAMHARVVKIKARVQAIHAKFLSCKFSCPCRREAQDRYGTVPQDQYTAPRTEPTDSTPTTETLSCPEVCAKKGMVSTKPDYGSMIYDQIKNVRCVMSAQTSSIRILSSGSCTCYPPEAPTVSFGEKAVCRGTPCGDVACDSSAECSCGENCIYRVSCSWGGWKRIGDMAFQPVIGVKSG